MKKIIVYESMMAGFSDGEYLYGTGGRYSASQKIDLQEEVINNDEDLISLAYYSHIQGVYSGKNTPFEEVKDSMRIIEID